MPIDSPPASCHRWEPARPRHSGRAGPYLDKRTRVWFNIGMTTTTNPHEAEARLAKARKIAIVFEAAEIPSWELDCSLGLIGAAGLNEQYAKVFELMGIHTPSEATWLVVLDLLRDAEAIARLQAQQAERDPFDGLV